MGWAGEASAVTHLAANNGRKKKLDEILDAPAADDDSYRISISA